MKRFVAVVCLFVVGAAVLAAAQEAPSLVRVSGLSDKEMKMFLGGEYDIAARGADFLEVVVTPTELAVIKKTGKKVRTLVPDLDAYVQQRLASQTPTLQYLTYDTLTDELKNLAAAYPAITRLSSIGKSWEGRDIWAMKVSDAPELDEKEPAALLVGNHHAREWTTVEVPMAVLRTMLTGYGQDERMTRLVNERETWIVHMVNPDGITWSQKSAKYWRKNRRPHASYPGVDLNRNYGFHWGNTGASDQPYSDTYHGPEAFSEPEIQAIKALFERERFQASLTYHSYSELVLYPFGYAYGVPNPDEPLFKTIGNEMASFNQYTVQNVTELYPCMGTSDDWFYGVFRSISLTFEMGTEFIPPVSEIAGQCAINVPASLVLIDRAAALAVNSPSGDPTLPATLDLEDGLAALTLGAQLLPAYAGEAREAVAKRLQSTVRRVADLAVDGLLTGDRRAWDRVKASPVARPALPMIRGRVLFESCHGADPHLTAALVAEVQGTH